MSTTELTKAPDSKVVRILQSPDPNAEAVGLKEYGMSKLPGTFHVIQPGVDNDNRWITGIDEFASYLNLLPKEEQTGKRAQIKKKREALQNQLGISDLSATSEFWDTYFIDMTVLPILDLTQAKHELMYYVLKANKQIMPDSTASGNPEYWDAKFIAHRPDFEANINNNLRLETDKAIVNAMSLRENYDKMYLIARMTIGAGVTKDQGVEVVYDRIRSWLDLKPKINSSIFNGFCLKDITELNDAVIIKDAIKFGVITYRNNQYSRGNNVLGRTEEDVLETLQAVDMRSEFESINSELNTKIKLAKS